MSAEERAVICYFETKHYRNSDGKIVVPLLKKTDVQHFRAQAVRRFLTMEHSLHSTNRLSEFVEVMEEYFALGHVEGVPTVDLQKLPHQVFYLPMHTVYKESSTTTKL